MSSVCEGLIVTLSHYEVSWAQGMDEKNKNVMGRNHRDMGKKRKSKQDHRCQPSCSPMSWAQGMDEKLHACGVCMSWRNLLADRGT